ncbi:hypothetical protein [Actinophytocola algeriensis]|uniref:Uncharacterized protein n=1 Tax=Actinophytocola algeriensis TaxID=1768010 RepID=A0A7W7QBJ5_9PSEU|nr:hypothetical protein [Actinophytocola algeriensis]MBB4910540.1 hypothetical protein [Actinophytocola algeriensis]MBE1480471.1 hypothetical protein [Actinophytocola algeriensis]
MTMAPKWHTAMQMTDEELVLLYDQVAEHVAVGLSFYRDEILRRAMERSAAEVHALAKSSNRLALWNMVVATIAVVVSLVAIIAV